MRDDSSRPGGLALCSSLELHAVWRVKTDTRYDARRLGPQPACLVAVRTHAGNGTIDLARGLQHRVCAGTLLLINNQQIRRYRPDAGHWEFWWFEFSATSPAHFLVDKVMRVADDPQDEAQFEQIFVLLRRLSFFERSLAAARFAALLYGWLAQWDQGAQRTPRSALIQEIVERMHAKLDQNWSVREMARAAHMCERHFRKVFARETGKSPKQYYDELRLREARALLSLGTCNVAQTACRLNFSSPAHLSKAFARHFKMSPSKLRMSASRR